MKVKIFATIAVVFSIACASNDLPLATVSGALNAESTIREHQDIVYRTSDDVEIRIQVLSIQEGRCPSDVTCIWEGQVTVSFKISDIAEAIELVTPPHPAMDASYTDNYSFSASGKNYRLVLTNVTPYPSQKNRAEVKSAVFRLDAE